MEEVKTYIANFDFENALSAPNYKPYSHSRENQAFEFLFLWLEGGSKSLFSKLTYEDEFLQYVKGISGELPQILDNATLMTGWWGDLDNEEVWNKERIINSKLTSFEARVELGLELLDSEIIESLVELPELKEGSFLLKRPYGFSGRGLIFDFSKVHDKDFPLILEPLHRRVRDFGVFTDGESFRISQNLIDKRGQYKGSFIKDTLPESEVLEKESLRVFNWYKDKFDVTFMQIDSYQYLDGGDLHFNFLCEVNHRNSMGQIANKLHEKFGDESSVFILIHKSKLKTFSNFGERLKELGTLSYNPVAKHGAISLSPVENDFQCFYITEESDRSLQMFLKDLWKVIGQNGSRLPSEFVIYF